MWLIGRCPRIDRLPVLVANLELRTGNLVVSRDALLRYLRDDLLVSERRRCADRTAQIAGDGAGRAVDGEVETLAVNRVIRVVLLVGRREDLPDAVAPRHESLDGEVAVAAGVEELLGCTLGRRVDERLPACEQHGRVAERAVLDDAEDAVVAHGVPVVVRRVDGRNLGPVQLEGILRILLESDEGIVAAVPRCGDFTIGNLLRIDGYGCLTGDATELDEQ